MWGLIHGMQVRPDNPTPSGPQARAQAPTHFLCTSPFWGQPLACGGLGLGGEDGGAKSAVLEALGPSLGPLGDTQPSLLEPVGVGRSVSGIHCCPRSHLRTSLRQQLEGDPVLHFRWSPAIWAEGKVPNKSQRPPEAGLVLALESSWGSDSCLLGAPHAAGGAHSRGRDRL